MSDLTVTAAQVGAVFPQKADIHDFIAAETITAGQAVFVDSNGKVQLADANASGEQQFRGIALNGGGAGQAISVLKRGHIYGFTITGLGYDAMVYLSNTPGALADAAGGTSVIAGRVTSLPDNSLTKVLWVEADWLRAWS